jgi:LysM domain
MSRTVFALVAIGAAVIAIALGVAWQRKMSDREAMNHAATTQPAPPPAVPTVVPPPEAKTAETSIPSSAVMAPSFDVARIDPDGRSVIAGRAAPGAKIVLLDGGKEIAHGEADGRGEWVLLVQEPPLGPGQHELRVVQHIEGRAPVTSEQVVVAVVPKPAPGSTDQTLVMIAPPGSVPTLVQPPTAAGTPKSGDLHLSTLDYDERGQVTVTGQAAPGGHVRAYIDDKMVGEGIAGKDGRWRVTPNGPVTTGKHTLRLDKLGGDGKPTARLEIPFDRQEAVSVAGDSRQLHVVRGDNLWNIARAHYGEGLRYTVIFNANKDQIRDPNLIYPGQIFSLPKVD